MKRAICLLLCFSCVFGVFAESKSGLIISNEFQSYYPNSNTLSQFFNNNERKLDQENIFDNSLSQLTLNLGKNTEESTLFSLNNYQNSQNQIVPMYSTYDYDTLYFVVAMGALVVLTIGLVAVAVWVMM